MCQGRCHCPCPLFSNSAGRALGLRASPQPSRFPPLPLPRSRPETAPPLPQVRLRRQREEQPATEDPLARRIVVAASAEPVTVIGRPIVASPEAPSGHRFPSSTRSHSLHHRTPLQHPPRLRDAGTRRAHAVRHPNVNLISRISAASPVAHIGRRLVPTTSGPQSPALWNPLFSRDESTATYICALHFVCRSDSWPPTS
jgi:hypothetical protein